MSERRADGCRFQVVRHHVGTSFPLGRAYCTDDRGAAHQAARALAARCDPGF